MSKFITISLRLSIFLVHMLFVNSLSAQMILQPITPYQYTWPIAITQPNSRDSILFISADGFDDLSDRTSVKICTTNTNQWIDKLVIDSNQYRVAYFSLGSRRIFSNDSSVIVPLFRFECDTCHPILSKSIDLFKFSVYDTLKERIGSFSCSNTTSGLALSTSNKFGETYIAGSISDSISNRAFGHMFLLKMDSNGNVMFYKEFGGSDIINLNSLLIDNDGYCLLSATIDLDASVFSQPQNFILRFDSDGNQTNSIVLIPDSSHVRSIWEFIGQTDDGYFFMSYKMDFIDSWLQDNQFVVMLDSNFEVVWKKQLTNVYPFFIYYFLGGLVNKNNSALLYGFKTEMGMPWLAKINLQGNFEWRIVLEDLFSFDFDTIQPYIYIADCIEKPWGGWWCVGSGKINNNGNRSFLLSIDSSGCVDQFCPEILSSTEYFVPAVTRVKVYPNPAHQQLNIGWESDAGASTANWELHNVMGQVVLQRELSAGNTSMQLPDLPSGLYHWTLRSKTLALGSGRLVVE